MQGLGGITALILAAGMGHIHVVELLIINGADITTQENRKKQTALDIIEEEGDAEIVALLQQKSRQL